MQESLGSPELQERVVVPPVRLIKGTFVRVWSKSKQTWFEDGEVIEVASCDQVVDKRKVGAGWVKVRFNGVDQKWLRPQDTAKEVGLLPYRWVSVQEREPLPERAVLVAPPADAETFVSKTTNGDLKPLSIALTDCNGRKPVPHACQVLALSPGFMARWVAAGEALPEGAVPCTDGHVARARGSKLRTMRKGDEVLVVNEVAGELELEIVRVRGLQGAEYRFGDVARGAAAAIGGSRPLRVYVEVTLQGTTQRCAWHELFTGDGELQERLHFAMADPGGLGLGFRVLDHRRHQSLVRGDPLIGTGELAGEALRWDEELLVDLVRGSRRSRLVVRARQSVPCLVDGADA